MLGLVVIAINECVRVLHSIPEEALSCADAMAYSMTVVSITFIVMAGGATLTGAVGSGLLLLKRLF